MWATWVSQIHIPTKPKWEKNRLGWKCVSENPCEYSLFIGQEEKSKKSFKKGVCTVT